MTSNIASSISSRWKIIVRLFWGLEILVKHRSLYQRNFLVAFTTILNTGILHWRTGHRNPNLTAVCCRCFFPQIIIQSVAGGERGDHLPVAHTCFNLLDLPRYPTQKIMKTKLSQAVECSTGFGLAWVNLSSSSSLNPAVSGRGRLFIFEKRMRRLVE